MIEGIYSKLKSSTTIDKSRYFDAIIGRTNLTLLFVIVALSMSIIFQAFKIKQLSTLDNVYLLAPDQTLVARRAEDTLERSEYEMIGFARFFIEKVFANNRYSFEENIKEIAEWMDAKSANTLLSEFTDEHIVNLYKEGNANSMVSLEKIVFDREKNPIGVSIQYKLFLHFLSSAKAVYEDEVIDGAVYFEIQPMKRSFNNTYGMQIRNLKFLEQQKNE